MIYQVPNGDAGHVSLYKGKMAFSGQDTGNIFYWDGTSTIKVANAGDYVWPGASAPSLYNGRIAFEGSGEIYCWNGLSIQQITNNSFGDYGPRLYDGKIAWYGYDGNDFEIYYYDGTSTRKITDNTTDDTSPTLYDGRIAWVGSDGKDNEIYYWDGSNIIQITNNTTEDRSPSLYGDMLTWEGFDGNDYEIYYTKLLVPIVPTKPQNSNCKRRNAICLGNDVSNGVVRLIFGSNKFPSQEPFAGTGFLIKDNDPDDNYLYILTAGHNLANLSDWKTKESFSCGGKEGDVTKKFNEDVQILQIDFFMESYRKDKCTNGWLIGDEEIDEWTFDPKYTYRPQISKLSTVIITLR